MRTSGFQACQTTLELSSFVQEMCPVRILDDKLPHDKRHEITTDFGFFKKTIIQKSSVS